MIRYALPISGKVTIIVFNTLGQPIVTLVNEVQGAGYHEIQFNGDSLASGIYLYQITAGSFVQAKKMLLIK